MTSITYLRSGTAMLWILLATLLVSACGMQGQETAVFRVNLERTGVFPADGPATLNELAWKFRTDGPIFSSPVVASGVVYIGSWDGSLYAINSTTGQEVWRFNTGGEIFSSPMITDETVYIGSGDGHLYAIHAKTGQEKWRFETESEQS